jgi:hypothetical protein
MVFEPLAIVINRLSPTEREFVITSDFKKYDKIMQAIKEIM